MTLYLIEPEVESPTLIGQETIFVCPQWVN